MPIVADVAVPVPLAQAFSYEVPPDLQGKVTQGARVICELGRRRVMGVVLRADERPPPTLPLKPILALVDSEPVLPGELLSFLEQMSSYYLAPVGEVLRLALPAIEREQAKGLSKQAEAETDTLFKRVRKVGGRRQAFVRATDTLERPGSLRGKAALVLSYLRANGEHSAAALDEKFGNARPAIKRLSEAALVEVIEKEAERDPFFSDSIEKDTPKVPTEAQSKAIRSIEDALAMPTSTMFLLFGITGSGKTEVYLQAIDACLKRGRGALILVPEIALTPQLVTRFRARFGDSLAVLHSAMSDADRHVMWKRLRRNEVRVAIGARSALFAPVTDLGLIVVDEEHDSSFKQEEGVRYNARDMALLRAHRAGAVAVLGSATPSLESIALRERGKLIELRLPARAHALANLPSVTIVDLRRNGPGPSNHPMLSLPLHRALEETLDAREQAILFLNRRGFAPSVVCESCGTLQNCRSCSVALTYHRSSKNEQALRGRVRCHYCDYAAPLSTCTECKSPSLLLEGLGTEKLEETLSEAFPTARIGRLDRDVASGANAEKVLDRMRKGDIDVLVGTQMVAKGHDLPNVTLVGIVNADASLSLPDFRASEKGFQLLVQVAGRAGRHERKGRVIIQTRSPEHSAVAFAAQHDVVGFLESELRDRKDVRYPPFYRLILLRVDAVEEGRARDLAGKLAALCRTSSQGLARQVEVLGPAPAPIARLRGRYRFRVLLRSVDRNVLRITALHALRSVGSIDRTTRVVADVDPVSML